MIESSDDFANTEGSKSLGVAWIFRGSVPCLDIALLLKLDADSGGGKQGTKQRRFPTQRKRM